MHKIRCVRHYFESYSLSSFSGVWHERHTGCVGSHLSQSSHVGKQLAAHWQGPLASDSPCCTLGSANIAVELLPVLSSVPNDIVPGDAAGESAHGRNCILVDSRAHSVAVGASA